MDRVATGIVGLDELLGGGIPKGRCILIVGSPGSGKTTLAMQFLCSGALSDERGLFVTMDESPTQIKENLSGFRWDLDKLEREGKLFFIDATPLRRVRAKVSDYQDTIMPSVTEVFPELTLKDLVRTLIKVVEEEKVQRIVVDPITSVMLRYEKPLNRRKATLTLFDALAATGCSSLVTTELRTAMLDREFQIEEFLSHGVILLRTDIHQGNVVRALQIEKMRGISHDMQWRPYQITAEGIQVFPKDRVF